MRFIFHRNTILIIWKNCDPNRLPSKRISTTIYRKFRKKRILILAVEIHSDDFFKISTDICTYVSTLAVPLYLSDRIWISFQEDARFSYRSACASLKRLSA